MKWLLTMLLTTSVFAFTTDMEGAYEGAGTWKNPHGKNGKYAVTMKIDKGTVVSHYRFENNEEFTYKYDLKMNQHGWFAVLQGNKRVGHGYCFKAWCHMEIPAIRLEEQAYFGEKDAVYRMGSKVVEKQRVAWIEELKKK